MQTLRCQFLILALALAASHAAADETNLTATLSVDRPMTEVVSAIQVYYTSNTNEPGLAILKTNQVSNLTNNTANGNYSLNVADSSFQTSAGIFRGQLVATSVATNVTRLDLLSKIPLPVDASKAAGQQNHAREILIQIAQIAETANREQH